MFIVLTLTILLGILLHAQQMGVWLTDPDAKVLFQLQPIRSPSCTNNNQNSNDIIIDVNTTDKYQTIDGFGYTLTGGSAEHLQNLDDGTRGAILQELFGTDKNNIGVSYLRLSIGASDLDEQFFSCSDLPRDQTDSNMTRFNWSIDHLSLIPVLKQTVAINPRIMLMGSPRSPPVWMKTNRNSVGGTLLSQYYDAYTCTVCCSLHRSDEERRNHHSKWSTIESLQ